MEQRYACNPHTKKWLEEWMKKIKMSLLVVLVLAGMYIIVTVLYCREKGILFGELSNPLVILSGAVLAIALFCAITVYLTYGSVSRNTAKNHLQMESDGICGIHTTRIDKLGKGEYFYIPYGEIKQVRHYMPRRQALDTDWYDLQIDCEGEKVYRLSLEKSEELFEQLNQRITDYKNKLKETPPKSPLPVYPVVNERNQLVCPNCGTEQEKSRGTCRFCGQVFINGQLEIPYWCGGCGAEGPFEENCPFCGSEQIIKNKL